MQHASQEVRYLHVDSLSYFNSVYLSFCLTKPHYLSLTGYIYYLRVGGAD